MDVFISEPPSELNEVFSGLTVGKFGITSYHMCVSWTFPQVSHAEGLSVAVELDENPNFTVN